MKSALKRLHYIVFVAAVLVAAACQTANQGTSTVTAADPDADDPRTIANARPESASELAGSEPARHTGRSQPAGLEPNVARPGSDYREIVLDHPRPAACQKICADQMRCMAFTYLKPDADRQQARCRLKHSVPDKVSDRSCCVSWVNPRARKRRAQLEAKGFELNTTRPGGDFRSFDLDRADPDACRQACDNLIACKAFTYRRPDGRAAQAHCQLKDEVPPKVTDQDCCMSGAK